VGATGLGGFWALEWAYSRNKHALRARLRNLSLRSQFSVFDSFRDIHVHTSIYDFLRFVGVRVGVANFFLDQSIGIDETNTFQLNFLF